MIDYVIEGKVAVITGCSDDTEEIILPEFLDEFPVAKIASNSFNELKKLKRLVLPKNLKLIGGYAFAGCKNLKEVYLNEGLEIIEDWAFISCNIDEVNIPTSLKSIGPNAFLGNVCKRQIEQYLNSKNKDSKRARARQYNMAIFPIGLLDNLDELSIDIITERCTYVENQIDKYEKKKRDFQVLDIPFAFDNEEFIIGYYSKNEINEFTVELADATDLIIGLYEEDDPDFLLLRLSIKGDDNYLGELYVKSPYLEAAQFNVVEVLSAQSPLGTRYFLRVQANLSCYGTGNLDREFAFTQFKELEGKYLAQLDYKLISEEVFNDIKKQIDDTAIDTVKSFLESVSGSPELEFAFEVLNYIISSEDPNDLDSIAKVTDAKEFFDNRLLLFYETLSDYDSFERVCFDLDDVINFITEYFDMSLEQIRETYGFYVKNGDGEALPKQALKYYRKMFADNEYNYTLYSDFLNYIYQKMQQLNSEFAMKTYIE